MNIWYPGQEQDIAQAEQRFARRVKRRAELQHIVATVPEVLINKEKLKAEYEQLNKEAQADHNLLY